MQNSACIRVGIVEDDPVVLNQYSDAINLEDDMVLVFQARALSEAYLCLAQNAPDIVLVDIGLPDGSGIDFIVAARQCWPATRMLISTVFGDERHIMQALQAGASGYLLKDDLSISATQNIRNLRAGGSPISPLIARSILDTYQKMVTQEAPLPEPESSPLTKRETEILMLISKGFTYKEISGLLDISRSTVMTLIQRIYKKLEVSSKTEAVYEGKQKGLLGLD